MPSQVRHWLALAGAWLLVGTGTLLAQAPSALTPEQRRSLEHVSLAEARAAVLTRVLDLPLANELTVRDWTAQDAHLSRALRLWVRTLPRAGRPRLYSDDVCESDVRLTPAAVQAELVAQLEHASASSIPAGLTAARIQAAAANWPILWTTGSATPPADPDRSANQPVGWENVSREGMELARRAAAADALDALLAEAGQLPVGPTRPLAGFLDSSPAVHAAVAAAVERAANVAVQLDPDQVAVANAHLSVRELSRILTRVHQEHYHGDEFAVTDFREMALHPPVEELDAVGLGTPPARTLLPGRPAPVELDTPTWAGTSLTATGRYDAVTANPPDAAAQRDIARLNALDQLRQQIEQLVIRDGVTVGDFLAYYQDLKPDVVLFITGARTIRESTASGPGGVEVTVELPLRRLWEILRRKMKLEAADTPNAKPRTRGPASVSDVVALARPNGSLP